MSPFDTPPCREGIQATVPLLQLVRDASSYLVDKLASAGSMGSSNAARTANALSKSMLGPAQRAAKQVAKQVAKLSNIAGAGVPLPASPLAAVSPPAPGAVFTLPPALHGDVIVPPNCDPTCKDPVTCCNPPPPPPPPSCDPTCKDQAVCTPCPPPPPCQTCPKCYVYTFIQHGGTGCRPDGHGCGMWIDDGQGPPPPPLEIVWSGYDQQSCAIAFGKCRRCEPIPDLPRGECIPDPRCLPPPPPPPTPTCPPPDVLAACCPEPPPPPDGQCCPVVNVPPCPPFPEIPPCPDVTVNVGGNGGQPLPEECCPLPADWSQPGALLFGPFTADWREQYYEWLTIPDLTNYDTIAGTAAILDVLLGSLSPGNFDFGDDYSIP